MLEDSSTNDRSDTASCQIGNDEQTDGDVATPLSIPDISDHRGRGIGKNRDATSGEESRHDQRFKIQCHCLGHDEADVAHVRPEEYPSHTEVLHQRKDEKTENGTANSPRSDGPIGMGEVGIWDVEVFIHRSVRHCDDCAVDQRDKGGKYGEACEKPFLRQGPVVWISGVVGSIP